MSKARTTHLIDSRLEYDRREAMRGMQIANPDLRPIWLEEFERKLRQAYATRENLENKWFHFGQSSGKSASAFITADFHGEVSDWSISIDCFGFHVPHVRESLTDIFGPYQSTPISAGGPDDQCWRWWWKDYTACLPAEPVRPLTPAEKARLRYPDSGGYVS